MRNKLTNNLIHNKPIFVVGHPRSGSTLLASLLGRHKEILALPETHFISASHGGNFLSRYFSSKHPDKYFDFIYRKNVRIKDVNIDENQLLAAFNKNYINQPDLALDKIFELALNETGKTRVLEKTPRHIENIDTIMHWYPNAKIICIIRDGRDAISSLIKAPWTHSNPERHAAYWRWCVHEAISKQNKYPNNVLLIRFEDLIETTDTTLNTICKFVDVEYSNDMINPDIPCDTVPSWESGWKDTSKSEIQKTALYKWKRDKDQQDNLIWEGWLRPELELLKHPLTGVKAKTNNFIYRKSIYQLTYNMWLFFRMHVAERRNNFRRKQVEAGLK